MKEKIAEMYAHALIDDLAPNVFADQVFLLFSVMPSLPERKSRCCGRCDGVNDLCVADMVCDEHNEIGCEVCYGARNGGNEG